MKNLKIGKFENEKSPETIKEIERKGAMTQGKIFTTEEDITL